MEKKEIDLSPLFIRPGNGCQLISYFILLLKRHNIVVFCCQQNILDASFSTSIQTLIMIDTLGDNKLLGQ